MMVEFHDCFVFRYVLCIIYNCILYVYVEHVYTSYQLWKEILFVHIV